MKHPQYVENMQARRRDQLANRYLVRSLALCVVLWSLMYAMLALHLLPPVNAGTHLSLFAGGVVICVSLCSVLARRYARRASLR